MLFGMKSDVDSSPQIETIHGSRVLAICPVTKPLERALELIAKREFAAPSYVIVQTKRGKNSGITHTGGRYLHPGNPYAAIVISMMRDQGIEPPPMPFIVASEASDLYHELGHHVDLCWSEGESLATFSIRWFSQFYEITNLGALLTADRLDDSIEEHAIAIASGWIYLASELFADLFNEWMQDKTDADSISCAPHILNVCGYRQDYVTRIDFLKGVSRADVRVKTYALFGMGLKGPGKVPDLRKDLFGRHTNEVLERLGNARAQASAEMSGMIPLQ